MKREQEIRQASIEYTIGNRPMCIGGGAFSEIVDELNRNKAFEEGVKWADEHPYLSEEEQVGLGGLGMMWQKKHLIDKACKWIEAYLFELGFPDDWLRDSPNVMNGEQRFRKAMEE